MLSPTELKTIIEQSGSDAAALLKACGAMYTVPKDASGKRLGPLVGYAGTYDDKGTQKQWVGETYINCAQIEQYPTLLSYIGKLIAQKVRAAIPDIETDAAHYVIAGPQMGGIGIGNFLAAELGTRFAIIEKKVTKAAAIGEREETKMGFFRHRILPGDKIIISEDVSFNFSTIGKSVAAIKEKGGIPVAVTDILNRSSKVADIYSEDGVMLKVIALLAFPIPEFRQDDEAVKADILAGNIIWKPKDNWNPLAEAMLKN
jgi:orotate phosphoribosyltransferase